MPDDVTDTITTTTRDAVAPTCTRYTFDGRMLEQTAAGWRVDRMIEECKFGIEVANRLERAEAIERAADGLLDYFAGMPLQSNHLLNLLDSLKAAKAGTTAPVVSSSDPCPECSSSRWAPDHDCPECLRREGKTPSIVATVDALRAAGGDAWDRVDVEGELDREVHQLEDEDRAEAELRDAERMDDARQTAVDGDAQRRHGILNRLWRASQDIERHLVGGNGTSIFDDLINRFRDAIEEAEPIASGPVAVETEAERDNERLRGEVERLKETLANAKASMEFFDRQAWVTLTEIQQLKASLAASQAREAETAKRCEAVVAAVDEMGDKNANADDFAYAAVGASSLMALRTAVDAIRPATTETHS